jgi:hypothetical protein
MLETLIQSLKTSCLTIPNIQEVFSYPLQNDPKRYPAIIFYQDTIDNSFETTTENFKIYSFSFFVVINIAGKTVKEIYETIMPKTCDDVMSHFDTNWNVGTVEGHRVWARISTNQFGLSIEEKGKTATIEMTLQVKTLTDN